MRSSLFLTLLLLVAACAQAQRLRGQDSGGSARTADQQAPLSPGRCQNTVQGRVLVADDTGSVCPWDGTNASGCCVAQALEPCSGCDEKSSCCSEFEFCVACCQRGPAATGGDWRTAARSPGHPESGVWTSAFDYCRGMCRTTPRSTVHENAYIAPRQHHCFGRAAFPDATAPPPLPALPSGVTAVLGDEGASCTVACGAAAGSQCAREGFAALNTCVYLQASFPCEGGCRAATGAHLPGYNSGAVPDASTLCVRSEAETATCEAAAQHVRRLCPCKASSGLLG